MTATIELKIERVSFGADAIAHTPEGKVVFVSGAVPQDTVRAEIISGGSAFLRAKTVEILESSPLRKKSICPYSDICGGCPWAILDRDAQIRAKRQNLVDSLVRIGKFSKDTAETLVDECESPSNEWGYRNKIELDCRTLSNKFEIGMHGVNPEEIIKVSSCALLKKSHAKLVNALGGALSYMTHTHSLGLERVGIRVAHHTHDVEVALWTKTGSFPRARMQKIITDASSASSVVRVVTKDEKKARKVLRTEVLGGKGCWQECVGQTSMLFSAPSFFQVNTQGAEALIEKALSYLNVKKTDTAMDLYCGAGTFTIPLAKRAKEVFAVEAYAPAVKDLKRNISNSKLDNVYISGGDAKREFPKTKADVIIVDPPRAGLDSKVIELLSLQPARALVYVSCDPATLARDLARFRQQGSFAPVRLTPVDLFPQTYHVETVVLISRK